MLARQDAGIILKNGTSFHEGINNAALCLADTLDIVPHRYGASQPSTSGTSRPSTSEHVAQSTPPKDFGKQNVSPHIVGDITSTVFTKLGLQKSPNFSKLMKYADEKNIRPVPCYKLLSSEGPSNNPRFVYTVTFKGKMVQGDKEKTKVKAIENCAGVYCELHEEHLYVPPTETGDLRDSVKETPTPSPLQPGQWLIGSPECPSVRLRSALTEREAPHWNALMRHASKEALDLHMCRYVDGGAGGNKTGFQFKLQCHALSMTALIGKKKQKEWEALESVAEVTCERKLSFLLQRNKRKTMVDQTGTEPPTLTVANDVKRRRVEEELALPPAPSPAPRPSGKSTTRLLGLSIARKEDETPELDEHMISVAEQFQSNASVFEELDGSNVEATFHVEDDRPENLTMLLRDCIMSAKAPPRLMLQKAASFYGIANSSCVVCLQLSSGCKRPSVCIRPAEAAGVFGNLNGAFSHLVKTCADEEIVPIIDVSQILQECPKSEELAMCLSNIRGKKLYLCAFKKSNCFYGWFAHPVVIRHVTESLVKRSLSYVFDLDETLVHAFTKESLEKPKHKDSRVSDLTLNQHFLNTWKECMAEYKRTGKNDRHVTIPITTDHRNNVQWAVYEDVKSSDGKKLKRPVIRFPVPGGRNCQDKGSICFTMIDPDSEVTCMAVFVRPGWVQLRKSLEKNIGTRKEVSVYVSTRGQKEYSYEIWRLLDPSETLIKREAYGSKIENTITLANENDSEKKTLASAIYGSREYANMNETLPFAVAIDDRTDVWKPGELVYNIEQYLPQYHLKSHERLLHQQHKAYMQDPLPTSGHLEPLQTFKKVAERMEELTWLQVEELESEAKDHERNARVDFSNFMGVVRTLRDFMDQAKRDVWEWTKLHKIKDDVSACLDAKEKSGSTRDLVFHSLQKILKFLEFGDRDKNLAPLEDTKELARVLEMQVGTIKSSLGVK